METEQRWDAVANELGIEIKPDFPFYVVEHEDDVMTFYWDSDHPTTSVFNDWTEQDFIDCLTTAAKRILTEAGEEIDF